MEADIAVIGLAVMGQNLVLNMNDHGYKVVVFNRTTSKVDNFLSGPAKATSVEGVYSLKDLFLRLKRPRKVMLMVKAGNPVDELIEDSLPFLEKGDILIDGGNSHFTDTERRVAALKSKGILFVGSGISGGEEGARHGASIMPGGNIEAWPHIKPIFQAIAAKAEDGACCCEWIGEGGSGHYVKMVHNGIEYGDMQLISEVYQILRDGLSMKPAELQHLFNKWNKGALNSYLIEITSHILGIFDTDGSLLLDKVLDIAAQKGTGKWTGISAFDLEVPVTLIAESVSARALSSLKDERVRASILYNVSKKPLSVEKESFINNVEKALYGAKIVSYAQGFMLMKGAATARQWNLNYGKIALVWKGGCIIRSRFLSDIQRAFSKQHDLSTLLLDSFFCQEISRSLAGWRETVTEAIQMGIPVPCLAAGLTFFDGYTTARLPANLIQAQRDCFGAHTYERTDRPRGTVFHTEWL